MSSLGVTVLPKDDSLQRAIMGVVAGWQQRRSEDAARAQQQSQFDKEYELKKREADSLIDTNTANIESSRAQTLSARANDVSKGFYAALDKMHTEGATPEQLTKFTLDAFQNFAASVGDSPEAQMFKTEVRARLVAPLTRAPDTPGGQMVRGALETGAAATARAAAGSQSPMDIDWSRKVATNADLSQSAYGDQLQREAGAEQHGKFADIAGGLAPDAEARLLAETQRSVAAGNNATQLQLGREHNASAERSAAARATAPAVAATTQAQEDQKQEAIRLIDELLVHPGRESGSGGTGMIARNIPATDARGFAAKVERLKSIMALDNLKLLKGAMSDKDLAFLMSIPAALDLGMRDDEVMGELQRARAALAGQASVANDPLGLFSGVK